MVVYRHSVSPAGRESFVMAGLPSEVEVACGPIYCFFSVQSMFPSVTR